MKNFWKFRFTSFQDPVDPVLDGKLKSGVLSGITFVSSADSYYAKVVFGNGEEFIYWNTNKYYAWMHEGSIGTYMWNNGRPSRKTLRAFYTALEEFKY